MTNDLLPDDRLIQNMCIAFIDGRIWPQTTSNYGVDPGDIRGMQNVLALLVEKGLVSTPNKPAEVDLDALNILNGDGILPDSIKEKVYKNWPKCDLPPEVKIATALKMGWSLDQVRDDVETTLRGCFKSIDVNDLKAELSHQICNGPESECTHCIAICQTVDYLASSGRLATGKGGGDAPQSNMVAVPREVIEEAAESIRFALNMDDLSDAEFSKLDLSLAMLQPYTRGE